MNRQEELQSAEPQQRDKGFTLIELLIVIVILGILSTIVVLSVRGITDQGKASACAADLKTLEIAQEAAGAKGITLTYSPAGTAEGQLVSAGLLRSASANYDITGISTISATSTTCGATQATGATAGNPGTYTGGAAPANFASIGAMAPTPATAWTINQHIVLGDATFAHWNATTWVTGKAP